jgi:starch phosphorylase
MVRHTLQTLGPKVLASRMVREYVERLYIPAARAAQEISADDFALARDLAVWKVSAREAWPQVRVEHVEVSGVHAGLQLGAEISMRAYLALGSLQPEDVMVEVVHGRVDADDVLLDPQRSVMEPVEGYEGNRWQYRVDITMDRNGPFGYTVRALPRHPGLSTPAELGLQALPITAGPVSHR